MNVTDCQAWLFGEPVKLPGAGLRLKLHRTLLALALAPLSGGGGSGKEQVKRETEWTEAERQWLPSPGVSVSLLGELVAS